MIIEGILIGLGAGVQLTTMAFVFWVIPARIKKERLSHGCDSDPGMACQHLITGLDTRRGPAAQSGHLPGSAADRK